MHGMNIFSLIICLLARCGGADDDPSIIVQQMLTGHHELLLADPCPTCCDTPSDATNPLKLRWWCTAKEVDMDSFLRQKGRNFLSNRRAVIDGLCLLRTCTGNATMLRRCDFTRERALQVRLRLSWALLTRGERAELAPALLNDALALVNGPAERRVVFEHQAWAALRVGGFEMAAKLFKAAVGSVDEELALLGESRGGSPIIQLHRRKPAASRSSSGGAAGGDHDLKAPNSDEGKEIGAGALDDKNGGGGGDSAQGMVVEYAEDAVEPVGSRVRALQHMAMVLEWRLGCALLCAGREAESLHYLRGVVEQAGSAWSDVVASALARAPREAVDPAAATTATTTSTARKTTHHSRSPRPQRRRGARKRAISKAAKAAKTLEESDGAEPLSQEWLVWHALRMVDLPRELPLVPSLGTNSGSRSSAGTQNPNTQEGDKEERRERGVFREVATGPVAELSLELRSLRRFLAQHRYLEASTRNLLGRALYKKGFTEALSRHLAASSLPWEQKAGLMGNVPQRLAHALTLPVAALSERDLFVSLAAAEDDLTSLLLDAASDRESRLQEAQASHRHAADTPTSTHFSSSSSSSSAGLFGGGSSSPSSVAAAAVAASFGSSGANQQHYHHHFSAPSSGRGGPPKAAGDSGSSGGRIVGNSGAGVSGLQSSSTITADCAGIHPSQVLSVEGALGAAFQLWPLEYWAGYYPQDEIEAILGEPLVHDPVVVVQHHNHSGGGGSGGSGGSGSGKASNARPPLGAILARLVQSVCPALGYPKPKPPVPPASPPPFAALREVQATVDLVKAQFQAAQLGRISQRQENVGGEAVGGVGSGSTLTPPVVVGAAAFTAAKPHMPPAPAPVHIPPLVVGVVAARMRNHAAARLVTGWIRHLSTAALSSSSSLSLSSQREVKTLAMCFPTAVDHWTRLLLGSVDGTVNLVPDLEESARRIKQAKPDVLLFVDLPLDWRSYALAALRLADVQVAFWGHAHSSHLASVDYFVLPPGAAPQVTAKHNHLLGSSSSDHYGGGSGGSGGSSSHQDDSSFETDEDGEGALATLHPLAFAARVASIGGGGRGSGASGIGCGSQPDACGESENQCSGDDQEGSGVGGSGGSGSERRRVGVGSGGATVGVGGGGAAVGSMYEASALGLGEAMGLRLPHDGEDPKAWRPQGGTMHPLFRNGYDGAPAAVHLLGRQLEQPVLLGSSGAGTFYDPLLALKLELEPTATAATAATSRASSLFDTPLEATRTSVDDDSEDDVIKSGIIYASSSERGEENTGANKRKRRKKKKKRQEKETMEPGAKVKGMGEIPPSSKVSPSSSASPSSLDEDLFDWVVPYDELKMKLHLPESTAKTSRSEMRKSRSKSDAASRNATTTTTTAGISTIGDDSTSSGSIFPSALATPAYVVLPLRTHQWHPELDHAVAKLLLMSSRPLPRKKKKKSRKATLFAVPSHEEMEKNHRSGGKEEKRRSKPEGVEDQEKRGLGENGGEIGGDEGVQVEEGGDDGGPVVHVVVVAEWTLVEGTGEGDAMTRHDIHQQASPVAWERRLKQRLASRLPSQLRKALMARVHWLPPLEAKDYLSVLRHARAALDTFPVANPVGCLDAMSVGTPIVTAPLLQREGFRVGASLWQGLLAECPLQTLNASLARHTKVLSTSAAAAAANTRKGQGQRKGEEGEGGGGSGYWLLPPMAEDAAGVARAALTLADHRNPWGSHLREVLVACRGALFNDDHYAQDLRRFLLNAAKTAKPAGQLYPASGLRSPRSLADGADTSEGDEGTTSEH